MVFVNLLDLICLLCTSSSMKWTPLVYFRCGADTSIKNNDGLTAEEILLKERPDGWEENLHWYNKFKPGTYSS